MGRPKIQHSMVPCKCGCGELIESRRDGKNRYYVYGHARRKHHKEYEERDMGYTSPCWVWMRSTAGYGYGTARENKRNVRAHLYIFKKHGKQIPEGMVLDHLCRVRSCVNPDHLEPVSLTENIRRGSQTYRLNEQIVREIRDRSSKGESRKSIGISLSIHPQYIAQIVRGERWK